MGRKGKAVAASSAKALEICGSTSGLALSAADVFAQFTDVPAAGGAAGYGASAGGAGAGVPASEISALDDAEVAKAMRLLQKKDPASRLRGVGDLRQLFASREPEALREACGTFLNMYQSMWPTESDARVREGLQRCLHALVTSMQRDFAKHLRRAFPTWLCSMFDTHGDAAQAARKAFAENFSTDDKRRGVFRRCQAECLDLLTSNLRHSEQSLHDYFGITVTPGAACDKSVALERQDRYVRVIMASLSGLSELVHICATPAPPPLSGQKPGTPSGYEPLAAEDVEPFFATGSPCALWPRLASKQPAPIRRAAAECLARLLQSPICGDGFASASARSSVLNTLADEAVPPAIASALVCSFAAAGGEQCWEGLSAPKALWPQLLAAVARGAPRDAAFLERLPDVLRALPKTAWAPERADALLRAILEALKATRAPAAQAWRAYFAVVRAADAAGASASDAMRWAPVESLQGGRAAEGDGVGGAALPTLPAAAMSALADILHSELPRLLDEKKEAGAVLLRALESGADALLAGTASGDAWRTWLRVLAALLRRPETDGGPAALMARQARRLMLAVVRWPVQSEGAAGAFALLDALGHFFSDAAARPDRSWFPAGDAELAEAAAMLGNPVEAPQEWSREAALLAWPLLPLWRRWLAAGGRDAASELGRRALGPAVAAALGAGAEGLRDRVAEAMLGAGGAEDRGADLGAAVRLLLEAAPAELGIAASPPVVAAVRGLAAAAAAGDLSGGKALQLALRPSSAGSVPSACARECLDVLMARAAEADCEPLLALRLSALAGGVLAEAGGDEVLQGRREAGAAVLLRALAAPGLGPDGEAEGARAHALLPQLCAGASRERLCEALGAPPESPDVVGRWAKAIVETSRAIGAGPAALLAECCGAAGAPARGAPRATAELVALCGAKVLDSPVDEDGELTSMVGASLFWEVLYAAELEPDLAFGAHTLLAWARSLPLEQKVALLRFCAEQAAQEAPAPGDDNTGFQAMPLAACLRGVGALQLLLLHVVSQDPEGSSTSRRHAELEELADWALDVLPMEADGGDRRAWGHVAAAILASVSFDRSGGQAQATWREVLRARAATGATALTPALLRTAAAVEMRAARIGMAPPQNEEDSEDEIIALDDDSEPEIIAIDGPVITEAPKGAAPSVPKELPVETVDAGLIEMFEQLLRWAQASTSEAPERCDAFATYASTIWPAISAVTPGMGPSNRHAVRMHRFVAEFLASARPRAGGVGALLGPSASPAASGGAVGPWAPPGALRLVAALCEAEAWPETSWPSVLQAVADASAFAEEASRSPGGDASAVAKPLARAFVEEVTGAAGCVLQHVPAGRLAPLVPLLGSTCMTLRAAAERRLLRHSWVPPERDGVSGEAWKVLGRAEAILDEGEEVAENAAAQASGRRKPPPSCDDVARGALVAVVGEELVRQAWDVLGANDAFLVWEADTDSEDEESEGSGQEEGGGEGSAPPPAEGAAPALAARRRRRRGAAARQAAAQRRSGGVAAWAARLPDDVGRRCLAALSAWRVLLAGVEIPPEAAAKAEAAAAAVEPSASPTTGGGQAGAAPRRPGEVLAAALQLAPEQLQGSAGLAWAASAPRSGFAACGTDEAAEPPLGPLLRLAFHVLNSPRLLRAAEVASWGPVLARDVGADAEAVAEAAGSRIGKALRLSDAGDSSAEPLPAAVYTAAAHVLLLVLRTMPVVARSFWESLPRQRDRNLVERLVSRHFSQSLIQAEATAAQVLLEAIAERLPDIEAGIVRRNRQFALQLTKEEVKTELTIQVPEAFPLRFPSADLPEKVPGIPIQNVRNWALQGRQIFSARKEPLGVSRVLLIWARSFALFFKGIEDCPICYNLLHLTTHTIPRKACPTCKHLFHSECLYTWFRRSEKKTCPLCNQPFS